mmetsp:Transcript_85373/g.163345  ORF Transcript_85373/g.163345 Transcript_85373/m.163345 type:complete len:605 (-) Transcript_85373:85-1899(-)
MDAASPALRALMMGMADLGGEDESASGPAEEVPPDASNEAEEARKRIMAAAEAEEARKKQLGGGGASDEAEEARKRMLGGASNEAEEARKRMLGGSGPSDEAEEARKRMLGSGGALDEAAEARKRMLGGGPSEAEEARRRMLGPPAKSGQIVRPPAHMKPAEMTVPKKPSIPLQSIYEGQKKTIAESAMELASSEAAPTMSKAGPPGMSKASSPAMTKASAPEKKTADSVGEAGTAAPMMSASVAIIDTALRKKIPVIPILAAAKRKKEQELKAGIKSETHDLDPELLLTQAIQTQTPAAMALLEAMDEMESEVPLKKPKLALQPAQGAADQSAMVPFGAGGGGGRGMPGMPGGMTPGMMTPGHPEFDPQQLFKAAEMLQMQAAWWETAATIADNLPQGMMTFGIGPTGSNEQYPPNCGRRMSDGKMDDGLPIIATQRIYTGVVKWFDAKKKGGFIECDELLQQGNEHIYCFQDILHQGRAGISDVVSFPLHTNAKGKLQASSPLLRLATNNGLAQTGVFHPSHAKGGQLMGGEIHCNIIKRVFGCYVKVSKELGEGLQFGRKVGFNFMVDAQGVCYAYAAKTVADDYIPKMGDLTEENAPTLW